MALKIFFDTNVILDFSIRRTPRPGIFNQIFDMVNMGKVQGFVTVSIIQTCSFYMLKYLDEALRPITFYPSIEKKVSRYGRKDLHQVGKATCMRN